MSEIHLSTHRSSAPEPDYRYHDGRAHMVVPAVAIVEGVLNNSFVSGEEIARSEPAWNGVPVPLQHPEENGRHVSANSPERIDEWCIGRFFHAHFDPESRSLKGELWINLERAQEIAPDMVESLEKGEPLEVSTAYFADGTKQSGVFNGEEYSSVDANLRPDHLAVLPGAVGACSWKDGCGAPRFNEASMQTNALSEARTPDYEGTEASDWSSVDKTFENYVNAYYENSSEDMPEEGVSSVDEAPQSVKDWIASKSLLGDPEAESFSELLVLPVVNPNTDALNQNAVRNAIARASQIDNAPEGAIESAQEKGRMLLEENFDEDMETNKLVRALQKFFGNGKKEEALTNNKEGCDCNSDCPCKQPETNQRVRYQGELSTNLGVDDLRSMLSNALLEAGYGSEEESFMFIEDIILDEQKVVFEEYVDAPLKMVGFSLMEESTIQIEGQAQEVVRKTSYKPVEGEPATNQENDMGELNVNSIDELIEQAPENLKDSLRAMHDAHKQQRQEKIDAIKANEQNQFSNEELNSFADETLDKLSAFAHQPEPEANPEPDYSGQGGPRAHSANEAHPTVPEPPKPITDYKKEAK